MDNPNYAEVSSVDLARGVVILMSGEFVPIANEARSTLTGKIVTVVAGPTADGQWVAAQVTDDDLEQADGT
jgi:hypothetical protein